MLITINILSIMRIATIFISIQNQQHRMSYSYSNQLYNSICLIIRFSIRHLQYSKIESVFKVIWTDEKYNNYFPKSLSNNGIHCIRVNNVV